MKGILCFLGSAISLSITSEIVFLSIIYGVFFNRENDD